MREIKEKAQAVIDRYAPGLAEKGLKILLAKRYFESAVLERSGTTGGSVIFDSIDRARDRKKEEENYHHEKNKYHVLIMTVIPTETSVISRGDCREYVFVLKKVERAHLGLEPRRIAYEEEKILSKIEKRLTTLLKKAEKMPSKNVCRETIWDTIRYSMSMKYQFKKRVLGKELETWALIWGIAMVVLALALLLGVWLAKKVGLF